MKNSGEIGIGLLGLGNVGAGVVKLLGDNATAIESRLGAKVVIRKIAVRSLDKPRLVAVDPSLVTSDVDALTKDPAIDIVVELIGGEEHARRYTLAAIDKQKQVVTANKLLLSKHGDEIFGLAEKSDVDVYFEAAVCAGVPVIRALREGLASDRILELYGIVNGTSNFILTLMTQEGRSFQDALSAAQKAGYAEANPALDIQGEDAAHKLAILMLVCFDTRISLKNIYVEGIGHLSPVDFAYAERLGYVIKPLVIGKVHPEGLEARVHPAMILKNQMLASVSGVNNAVSVVSEALGQSMYYGRGAGMMPTAVAVVSDIIEVSRNILARQAQAGAKRRAHPMTARPFRDMGMLKSHYYLRFGVLDRPGVLAQLAGALGEHGISIAQMMQEGKPDSNRPTIVVVTTHTAMEKHVQAALSQIDKLESVVDKTCLVRIVE